MNPHNPATPVEALTRALEKERNRRSKCLCVSTTVAEWCEGPDGKREPWQKRCACPCHADKRVREGKGRR